MTDHEIKYPIDERFNISFRKILFHMTEIGKYYCNPRFKIPQADEEIIYRVIAILVNDEKACLKLKLDPAKGVLLSGPIGCGKTTIMNIAKYIMNPREKYLVRATRKVTKDFFRNGYTAIDNLSRTGPICFDDLGMEKKITTHYGEQANVMAEILLNRYDLLVNGWADTERRLRITHATTNRTTNELEEAYGNTVRSRMKEMFNLIAYPSGTRDKRK